MRRVNSGTPVFVSPLLVQRHPATNRIRWVGFRVVTPGPPHPSVMVLSYGSVAEARQARKAVVKPKNAVAVPHWRLWNALQQVLVPPDVAGTEL